MLIEVCANSLESALNAQSAGADRIELCSELAVGGITPSHGLIEAVIEALSIPVHVLIRPRSGDFTYSKWEVQTMLKDIAFCRSIGVRGIVSGMLRSDMEIDEEGTKTLIEASEGMHFTFHRAFDWVHDPLHCLYLLDDLGVDTILASGQDHTALAGIDRLSSLNKEAVNCQIMPGGAIGPDNIQLFVKKKFSAVHLSGTKRNKNLTTSPGVPMYDASKLSDTDVFITDISRVRDVVSVAKGG